MPLREISHCHRLVARRAEELEDLLDEVTMASPAISEGTLYFRTRTHLLAIGN